MKMKLRSTTAIIAALAIVMPMATGAAAESEAADALAGVKTRISVPAELTEFDGSSYTENGKTTYDFYWHDEDYSASLSVSSDAKGRIKNYSYYYYGEYTDSVIYADKSKSDYIAAADEFVRNAFPELFGTGGEELTRTSTGASITYDNTLGVEYTRHKNGIPVKDNTVYLNVKYTGEQFVVTYLYSTVDYDAEFKPYSGSALADPEAAYYAAYPLELAYMDDWSNIDYEQGKDPMRLVYRFRDNEAGFIDAQTGETVEEDLPDDIVYSAGAGAMNTEEAADKRFTDAERRELDNIAGLKSTAQIIKSINNLEALGEMPPADKFSRRVEKYDDQYMIYLSYYDEEQERSISISADGMSGAIQSFDDRIYGKDDKTEYGKDAFDAAAAATESFIGKFFADKLTDCGDARRTDNAATVYTEYTQLVNGVKNDNNFISALYDLKREKLTSFYMNWDEINTDLFPKPDGIVSYDTATAAMSEITPLINAYVKSDDVYTPCFYAEESYAALDAFTGESLFSYSDDEEYIYSDISGHWAENIINALAQYGIGFDKHEFLPDEKITQSDLLSLTLAADGYYVYDDDDMYRAAVRAGLVTEEEIAPDS